MKDRWEIVLYDYSRDIGQWEPAGIRVYEIINNDTNFMMFIYILFQIQMSTDYILSELINLLK